MRSVAQLDEPNLVIPLGMSLNQRGVVANTNLTNSLDQRKINCHYEPVTNAFTGGTNLYLTKRQGVAILGNSFGTTGQVAYLVSVAPGTTRYSAANTWVFSTSGNDIRASNTSTTTVVVTAAGYTPAYVDMTSISGTETLVLQLRNASLAQRVFYSSAIATFTEITDSVFTALTVKGKMEFLDGYAFALATDNKIYNSNLNSLSVFAALNAIPKQISQDAPFGLMRLGNQILAMGAETAEVFHNVGSNTGSPLETVQSLYQRVGLASIDSSTDKAHYYATLGNKIYFPGRVGGAQQMCLMSYNGQTFEKASNTTIDKILLESGFFSISAVSYRGKRAIAIQLTATSATTQRWLMFFPDWNDWCEFHSTTFSPVNNGLYYLGVGTNQHKLYDFTTADNWQDDSVDYTMTLQFKLPSSGNHRKFMPMCGVIGDTSRSASSLAVSFSDDDYQSYSTPRNIDMTQVGKKHLYRCGSYSDRAVKMTHTGNTALRMEKFVARINQ